MNFRRTLPPKIEASRQPRFFIDLTWTQPFGGAVMARRLAEIDRKWHQGLVRLETARRQTRGRERDALENEIGVARLVGCMFRTAHNLVLFQQLRENVTSKPCSPAVLKRTCLRAVALLEAEMANARVALAATERDPSLGYGATYGYAFDADLIRQKIAYSELQICEAVPRFYSLYVFHMYGKYEDLVR